jgi:hypothetical protein
VPGALSAYQEWLGEWMSMVSEDGRHFIADGQKIVDRSVSCFADRSPVRQRDAMTCPESRPPAWQPALYAFDRDPTGRAGARASQPT